MINLDSILKSRDITLPTKVHLFKAMLFPVVMYGCESWTIKKSEGRRIDALELRESFPRQVDKKSRGPQGERGLEFSRRKKGQIFFLLYIPQDYITTMYYA